MITEVQKLLDDYRAWLKDKTQLRQVEDWVEITTPYLDRHNDYVQIYAGKTNGTYTLTDDGYTIADLELSGCNVFTAKREAILRETLNGFGVQLQKTRLEVQASPDNFALRKHNLVQAILAVNDMFYLAQPSIASLFFEDVERWLEANDVRYSPRVQFKGKTGFEYTFDFLIPKSKTAPERILKTINNPKRDSAQTAIIAWIDTKEVRPVEARAYAVLNDAEHAVPGAVLEALTSYEIKPLLWSERGTYVEELAA